MKIALVIERMDPALGGREVYTAQVAGALATRGHEVTVVCQRANWSHEGVAIRELGRRGWGGVARMRRFVADVQAHTAAGEYDVVHAMLAVPGVDIYHPHGGTVPGSRDANRRRRGPLGRPVHALLEPLNRRRALRARLEREIMAEPRTVCLAVSETIAEHFQQYYGRRAGVRVVFNSVAVPDASAEQRADWRQQIRFDMQADQNTVVLLVVATNFPLKGVAETIAAFAKWYHGRGGEVDARLVVVGRDIATVEAYQRLAGLRDVGRRVTFVGPTPEVFRWYCAADAFVLLTWYDPCSLTVLEATRWRLPSLTTRFNGAARVLADGAGLVVDSPRHTDQVTGALDKLADPAWRAEAAKACEALDEYLSLDRHVDELIAVYEEVVAGRE